MNKQTLHLTTAITILSCLTVQASAGTGFSGEVELTFGVDSVVNSDIPANEFTDVYGLVEAAVEYDFGNGLKAFAALTIESVTAATDDRFLQDLGLYFDELGLSYTFGSTSVFGGKITPKFAAAWDTTPGLYGTSFAEDYELAEFIGVGIETEFEAAGGNHTFTVSSFFADTTILSTSLGTNRGRTNKTSGGLANTESLNSFAVQLAGAFGTTEYNISASHLAAGVTEIKAQNGASVALSHSFAFGTGTFTPMGEVAYFNGAGGVVGKTTYTTLGASYALDKFTFNAAHTSRNSTGISTDTITSMGFDYSITDATEIDFGVARIREAGVYSTNVGVELIHSFAFGG